MVNNSFWQLYSPPKGIPDVDIVFFHGLHLGYLEASTDNQTVWPQINMAAQEVSLGTHIRVCLLQF